MFAQILTITNIYYFKIDEKLSFTFTKGKGWCPILIWRMSFIDRTRDQRFNLPPLESFADGNSFYILFLLYLT